jgi:two-component system, NtrC family, sensor kinase
MIFKKILLTGFILFFIKNYAQVIYDNPYLNLDIENNLQYFEDKLNVLSVNEISQETNFKRIKGSVHNFGITSSAVWFKVTIENKTNIENLILQVNQPIIDEIDFYDFNEKKKEFDVVSLGEYKNFNERKYLTPEYLFDLVIPEHSIKTYFLKVKCKENMQVPMSIGTRISVLNSSVKTNIASGIYFGIMIVMILYNLFIYATLKDKSYILYSIYIVLILFTQTSLQGFTFQLIWPNFPLLAVYSPFIFPAFVGMIAIEFFKQFLQLKDRFRVAYKLSFVFLAPYLLSIFLGFAGFFSLSFMLVEITASAVSVYMLTVAFMIYRKGFSEARFFLIGWSVFLLGICIYVLKDFEILPYNGFTRYTMHFGSAVEVILLSFALADKINILKKEKEESQAQALLISQQNQKLITEQNIVLEQKVQERTLELEETNEELNVTLSYLKDTQTQLVNAEKMASLGQLTAGIAHEINNPINFVSANLKPLKLDISEVFDVVDKYDAVKPGDNVSEKLLEIEKFKKLIDLNFLKKEISSLLNGIEDGARRTSEIVLGLKSFSRLDESDIKEANINEGIESTLVLIRSTIPDNVEVVTQLGNVSAIECYPGKLNQVFMNILTNAIYAIKQKSTSTVNRLSIATYTLGDHVCIKFEDTGIGMTKEVKEKIFEPFFTTKDVGEGTGLGMSIVFKIIESHHAKMEIESEPGVGTKITIVLNKKIG